MKITVVKRRKESKKNIKILVIYIKYKVQMTKKYIRILKTQSILLTCVKCFHKKKIIIRI